jgi:hypothetical protein
MRVRPCFLSILLLLSPTLAVGTSITDSLWIAAVKSATVAADWVPGDAAFLIQLVNDKGLPQETWQTWYRLSASSTGEVTMDVTRASHNDTDTTQKEQENQKKRKSTPFSMGDNPFDPLMQDAVEARRLPDTVLKGGVSCVAFDFSMKKKDATTITGTAWLDARSGIPVEVSYTSQPLPRGLFKMTMTLRYASGPAGDGFLNEVLVEGVGGFLFIKKNFRSTITLGGYWRRGS